MIVALSSYAERGLQSKTTGQYLLLAHVVGGPFWCPILKEAPIAPYGELGACMLVKCVLMCVYEVGLRVARCLYKVRHILGSRLGGV